MASQDADVGLDDDGDYFTWTLEEARAVLSGEELDFAAKYWDIGELGDMHHNPAKNVLHVNQTLAEMAAQTGGGRRRGVAQATRPGPREAAGGARAADRAFYRPHTLHRLECNGGDGLSGSGQRAARREGAGVRAADARTGCLTRRGTERRR